MALELKADSVGIIASSICLIHCIATPFIFIAKACSSAAACCIDAPLWWQLIDYLFIVISFLAIYYSTQHTPKPWVRNVMWICWALLFIAILNESFSLTFHSEFFIYLPAFGIIGMHFYNMKYCNCEDDTSCLAA